MLEKTEYDIDYEHLDDLPLHEHVEWNHLQCEALVSDPLDAIEEDYMEVEDEVFH